MTLIAFAAHDDHAELLTDTAAYTPLYRHVKRVTKFAQLPHIDTVIATQGNHDFGALAKVSLGEDSQTFDDLTAAAPATLRDLWHAVRQSAGPAYLQGSVFVLGYSPAQRRFLGYRYLAEHDFERELVDGLHYMPAPFNRRPMDFEVARLRSEYEISDRRAALLQEWAGEPLPELPTDVTSWARLALEMRHFRSVQLGPWATVVAGQALYTRLEVGLISTTRLFDFEDHGDELKQLVDGSLHPVAQQGPCACGSGRTALDCHLGEAADEPCPCDTGRAFRDCCMLGESAEVTQTLWTPPQRADL